MLQLNKRGGDMTSTKPDKAAILNQVVKVVSTKKNVQIFLKLLLIHKSFYSIAKYGKRGRALKTLQI